MIQGIRFSVVIPAYNAVRFIEDGLKSILKQAYLPFEIIVVDDGSVDNTADVVKNFFSIHKEVKWYLIHQENKKVAAARNAGINVSTGEWIAFLDADDVWHKSKLAKVAEIINNNPQIDLICHDEIITKEGRVVKKNYYGPYNNYLDILFKSCCLSTSAVCVKRERIIEVGGFNEKEGYFGTEDFDLWVRLAKICKFYYLHEILGECRVTEGSITKAIERHSVNFYNVVCNHYNALPDNLQKKFNHEFKKRCADIFCGAGNRFMKEGDIMAARKWYLKGIIEDLFFLKAWIGYICALLKIKVFWYK